MDIVLIVLGAICLLIGLLGSVLPVLPGVPLSYLGLWLLHWTDRASFSWQFLTVWAVVVLVIQLLDYFIPAWGTKKFGGTKWGVWGSTIGLLLGFLMGPLGIVLGPFVGAVVGELLYFNQHPETLVPPTPTIIMPQEEDTQSEGDTESPRQVKPVIKPKPQTPFNRALRAGFGSFIGLLAGTIVKIVCCGMMIYYFVKELI
ncbi:MAG: DUF456 family protein [Paludibacteraceae bacterium]|nr:DUF456 family protein [Paludibacteraceae bacterium]